MVDSRNESLAKGAEKPRTTPADYTAAFAMLMEGPRGNYGRGFGGNSSPDAETLAGTDPRDMGDGDPWDWDDNGEYRS